MAIKVSKTNRTLAQSLAMNYRVGPIIDNYLENNPEYSWSFHLEPKISDDAFHPSGDCTTSLYDLVQKIKGHSQYGQPSLSLKKTFSVGHYFHQWIQDILVRSGTVTSDCLERRGGTHWDENPEIIDHDYWDSPTGAWGLFQSDFVEESGYHGLLKPAPYKWATGSADVVPMIIDGVRCVIDIKSASSQDMKSQFPPSRFNQKWECQGNVYADWFDCDEAIFLLVNKDSPHDFKEYVYKRNIPLINAIYEKWKFAGWVVDNNEEISEDDDFELPFMGPIS